MINLFYFDSIYFLIEIESIKEENGRMLLELLIEQ